MDADKLIDSVKFLLKSVRQLSDSFVETNGKITRSFQNVRKDVSDLEERLEKLDVELQNLRDQALINAEGSRSTPDLPIRLGQQDLLIPALNLPFDALLDVYRNTPSLMQPFARACSVSGRTLSGLISEIELEAFAQGPTWMIETQDADWVLLPRPGILQRQAQIKSLSRLFEIEMNAPLPAEIDLLRPGMATVVEHGRRWYLKEKGLLGVHSDPLQRSLEVRIKLLEQQLKKLSA
jgi:hypothetical protein